MYLNQQKRCKQLQNIDFLDSSIVKGKVFFIVIISKQYTTMQSTHD